MVIVDVKAILLFAIISWVVKESHPLLIVVVSIYHREGYQVPGFASLHFRFEYFSLFEICLRSEVNYLIIEVAIGGLDIVTILNYMNPVTGELLNCIRHLLYVLLF